MSLQLPALNTHGNGSTTPLSSLPPSPGPSTLLPAAHIHTGVPDTGRTILMPSVRPPRLSSTHLHTTSPRPIQMRGRYHGSPKMSRSKHTSVSSVTVVADSGSAESSPVIPPLNPHDASHWFPSPCNFQVAKDQIELSGFQLYAVEKWYAPHCIMVCNTLILIRVTERKRPVITLAVYTGDPAHKVGRVPVIRMTSDKPITDYSDCFTSDISLPRGRRARVGEGFEISTPGQGTTARGGLQILLTRSTWLINN